MTRIMLMVLSAGMLFAADRTADDDETRIQGTWTPVSAESAGIQLSKEEVTGTLTFRQDKFRVNPGEEGLPPMKGTFSLDPSTSPKSCDWTYDDGPLAGKNLKGIYRIEGDTLELCVGEERPTEFASKSFTCEHVVYKRTEPCKP